MHDPSGFKAPPEVPKPNLPAAEPAGAGNPIGSQEIIAGLAGIAMDENAPVTARVSAYNLLGKHLGLFAGGGGESDSDLAALMREIADRNQEPSEGSPQEPKAGIGHAE